MIMLSGFADISDKVGVLYKFYTRAPKDSIWTKTDEFVNNKKTVQIALGW